MSDSAIWNLETWLEQAQDALNKLYGLPHGVLVLIWCIVFGYVLKMLPKKWFPNDGIPIGVILGGAIINLVLGSPKIDSLPINVWRVKLLIVGMIIGFVAWMIHKTVIKKIENGVPWLVKNPEPK